MLPLWIALVISVSLASRAKQPITQVRVKVGDTFSGYFRSMRCIPGVQDAVVLDATAEGYTSVCPSGDVGIAVVKPSRTFRIAPENIQVRTSKDGTPVRISTQIP